MTVKLNSNIKIINNKTIKHSKATEEYISVEFTYPKEKEEKIKKFLIPIVYKRMGIEIQASDTDKLYEFLNDVYNQINPANYETWLKKQEKFWKDEHPNAKVTKSFFDVLVTGGWKCPVCDFDSNPNYARRIQELKDYGYLIATDTKYTCPKCHKTTNALMLIPVNRGNLKGNGYEVIPPKLRKRIMSLYNNIDVYENKENRHCLPDHKFSEIRWDDKTKTKNLDTMTDDEIKAKFQLLTNQRNQEKREVCRNCFNNNKRGKIFGIDFYYKGDENWELKKYGKTGKKAEKGCEGCPWYDIDRWRKELNKVIKANKKND